MKQPSKHLSEISYYLSKNYTYSQIARELRISRERVRQICLEHFGYSMSKHKRLSPEEKQAKLNHILNMLEQGYSFKAIAQFYGVSASCIHTFLSAYREPQRIKITPDIVEKIYQLWNAGSTYKVIQDELGISQMTIYRYLKKDPAKVNHTPKNAKVTQDTRNKVIELFKQGKEKSDISFDLRISVASIIRILRQAKLIPLKHDISVVQRCQELRKQGYTTRAISQELKISTNDTCFYLKMQLN